MKKQHSKLATRRAMAIGGGLGLLLVLGVAVSGVTLGGDDTSAQPVATPSESLSPSAVQTWACAYYRKNHRDIAHVQEATTLYSGTAGHPGAMFGSKALHDAAHDLLEGAEAHRDGQRYDLTSVLGKLDRICSIA